MLFLVASISVGFFLLLLEQNKYEDAIKSKEVSILLAEELRQSSNDLAKLVRKFIVTGNVIYKEQFFAVVELRDGYRARPNDYSLAYWDIKLLENPKTSLIYESREKISLIDLMIKAGYTEVELKNLKAAKAKSDLLVAIEKKAMKLVSDKSANHSIQKEKALLMLADDYFVKIKSDIMALIIEAEKMVIQRTQEAVSVAKYQLKIVTIGLFIFCVLLIILIFKVGQQLKLIIGCSIDELQEAMSNLGKGDFLTPMNYEANNKNVLGLLTKAQQDLAQLNLSHFKAIIESSDDAIISKSKQGIISSWNKGAERIFGYKAEDMIGQPMIKIIPEDCSGQ